MKRAKPRSRRERSRTGILKSACFSARGRSKGRRERADRRGLKERFLSRLLVPIAPALVGSAPGLPEVDSAGAAVGAAEMICRGPFEVFLTVVWGVVTLNFYSLFRTGRLLRSLKKDRQSELFSSAFHSRFFLLRGTSVLVGLPLKVSFYNQDDVCRGLGYDREELVEDALKHQVTRGA